jgi:hypothetical protein
MKLDTPWPGEMATKMKPRRSSESGQSLVLVALMMTGIMGFAALAIDVGYFQSLRRKMQTAADAAALAASRELSSGNSTNCNSGSNCYTAAANDATTNGFTAGTASGTSTSVSIGTPQSGPYASTSNAVEVDISQTTPSFLLAALGTQTVTIKASATAAPGGQPACIYALDHSASSTIGFTGNVNITTACGMLDDSSSSSAFDAVGNINITGTQIGIVGGDSLTGNISINPSPVTGMAVQSDPLSGLTAPTVGSCNYTQVNYTGNQTVTLPQGVYCGTASTPAIDLGGNTNVTFSGTYIINGGGLVINGNSVITGTGVTFYLTGTSSTYKSVQITGNSSVSLSAPTTGTYEGILFFQDRTITGSTASNNPNKIVGNSSGVYTGALYFPTTALNYVGNTSNTYTILVADTISFTGNTNIGNNYSSLTDGTPIKQGNPLSPVSLAQ